MNHTVRKLQKSALVALTELVQSFEERWEEDAEARAKEHEFVDETEVLMSFGETAFDELYAFLKEEGAWLPTTFSTSLQEAARYFLAAYTLQTDADAIKAKDALYKGFEGFQQSLIDKGIVITP